MPKFFLHEPVSGDMITIIGEDAAHLRLSLRTKPGDTLTVCDCAGGDFLCEVVAVEQDHVSCKVLERCVCMSENPFSTVLYLALTKADKFEFVVQKAVELGADRIVPVLTSRCISRPDARAAQQKVIRWQAIAESAAKQSGRGRIPEVFDMMEFKPAAAAFCHANLPLFCYENAEGLLSERLKGVDATPHEVAAFIGPEGGFSPTEAKVITEGGGIAVSLGKRILRAETAPIALLCAINFAFGMM